MSWAVSCETKSSGQKLVLIMLANYCNSHTGQCNPSHQRLSKECCMSTSALKVHIKCLEDDGFLSIERRSIDGSSLPNQYILRMDGSQNLATNQ
jgi:DNA-binding MarR family transcriptional regulator